MNANFHASFLVFWHENSNSYFSVWQTNCGKMLLWYTNGIRICWLFYFNSIFTDFIRSSSEIFYWNDAKCIQLQLFMEISRKFSTITQIFDDKLPLNESDTSCLWPKTNEKDSLFTATHVFWLVLAAVAVSMSHCAGSAKITFIGDYI